MALVNYNGCNSWFGIWMLYGVFMLYLFIRFFALLPSQGAELRRQKGDGHYMACPLVLVEVNKFNQGKYDNRVDNRVGHGF